MMTGDGAAATHPAAGRPAGVVTRTAADLIDVLLALGAVLFGYFGVAGLRFVLGPRGFAWPTLPAGLLGALYWLVLVLYLTAAWSSTGRSIGKQVLGLRVERRDGSSLGPARAFLRAILCATVPIGLFWCVVDRRSASLQDLIVGTRVVYDWRARNPNPELPAGRSHAAQGTG